MLLKKKKLASLVYRLKYPLAAYSKPCSSKPFLKCVYAYLERECLYKFYVSCMKGECSWSTIQIPDQFPQTKAILKGKVSHFLHIQLKDAVPNPSQS